MSKPILIALLALCSNLHGQMLNELYHVTDNKDNAKYYRQRIPQEGGGYTDKIYHLNDTLHSVAELSSIDPAVRHGKYTEYHENGKMRLSCHYVNGLKNGKSFTWHDNGTLSYEEDYLNGELHGYVKGYYKTGVPRRVDRYVNGQFVEGRCFGVNGQDTNYFEQSKMALFKNGDLEKYRRYVTGKLVYPPEAVERNITGDVYVAFSVNSKGKVVEVKVIESPNHFLSKAAVDVILASPNWTPARQEGKTVKQRFVMPVFFRLQ